ncbi:hypothetical protein ABZ567_06075 [Streptomyces sp. NPDC016459]|uniref:hypothetical protein n=1 Tax=Streptomyces sp. NPDC016459 TaxID=3157190 RepID=UPI0033C34F98
MYEPVIRLAVFEVGPVLIGWPHREQGLAGLGDAVVISGGFGGEAGLLLREPVDGRRHGADGLYVPTARCRVAAAPCLV